MFGYDVYKAYANVWEDITNELRELRKTWLRRGYLSDETEYALGLAILTARARRAEQGIDAETAKTALWLASTSGAVGVLDLSVVVDAVIRLLRPLRDQYLSGWASLLNSSGSTDLVLEELIDIYDHVPNLEDWAKTMLADSYAWATVKIKGETYEVYLNMACSLLNEIRDDVLRTIAEAYVYHYLADARKSCPNVDLCRELEVVNQRLEDLKRQASNPREFLKNHPGFEEYLWWFISAEEPEKKLNNVIEVARSMVLESLCEHKKE